MSHQFKPGDLAMIVGARNYPSNIGKTCELIEFLGVEDMYVAPNGVVYQHQDVPCWTLVGDDLVAVVGDEVVSIGFGIHEPRHLMPLQGDCEPEQQKAKEAEPCL